MSGNDRDYTGLFAEEMDLLSDEEFSAFESEHAEELATIRVTHATLRDAERAWDDAYAAGIQGGDFSIHVANLATVARCEAEHLAEHVAPWGDGKTEAELTAELERRVAAWEATRDPRALSDAGIKFKAMVDLWNRDALIEEAREFALSLHEFFSADEMSIDELEQAVAERRQRDEDNRSSTAAFWVVLEGRPSTMTPETGAAAEYHDSATLPPFVILTRAELRALPPISWLIAGLVQTHGIVILGGDGGVGKTAVALGMAGSVATGTAWHGRSVEQGNVLYIAGEGAEGVDARLQAWEAVTSTTVPEDRMQFVSEGFSLSSTTAVDYAKAVVADNDYSLVILDTLSQLSSLESENDNAELAKVINRARAIRQARPGATVIIVHHTSKEGRLRGASVLRNNSDAVIIARSEASTGGFFLSTEPGVDGKQKNGPSEKLDGFWLDQVAGSVVVRRGGRDPIVQAITATAADGAEHSGAEFYFTCEANTDAKKKSVMRALGRLVDDGTLVHNGAATTAARWRRA
jgi:hypothetical protein